MDETANEFWNDQIESYIDEADRVYGAKVTVDWNGSFDTARVYVDGMYIVSTAKGGYNVCVTLMTVVGMLAFERRSRITAVDKALRRMFD